MAYTKNDEKPSQMKELIAKLRRDFTRPSQSFFYVKPNGFKAQDYKISIKTKRKKFNNSK